MGNFNRLEHLYLIKYNDNHIIIQEHYIKYLKNYRKIQQTWFFKHRIFSLQPIYQDQLDL